MKPLVFASYAQFGVDAGDEGFWATRNGIRITTHNLWRPVLVVILYVLLLMNYYETGLEPVVWRKLCAV